MSESTDVWVEVEVLKGSLVSVYRGRVARTDFDGWRKGDLGSDKNRAVIALHDVYWSYDEGDGNEGWVVVGATPGPYSGATGTAYVRSDLILVMVQLRDGSEREMHKVRPVGGGARDDDY